VTLQYGNN